LTGTSEDSAGAHGALKSCSLFEGLPDAIIDQVAERASLRRFGVGETIFSPGQFDGAELLFLASGSLKASRADPARGSMVVETIAPGSFYALELAVLPPDTARYADMTVSAETASAIALIDAEAFRALVAQRPLLARALLIHFVNASIGAGATASEAAPDRRVFAAIAALVRRDAVEAVWRIAKMPKHRDLADLANVAENEAASAVARLISSGVARRDYPGLVIEDMAQLNRLAR
jgi:CRP-like cAMP-binding protein